MQTGTVKFFNEEKGFGYIKPDDGAKDLFFHQDNVNGSIAAHDEVEYDTWVYEDSAKGPVAINVTARDSSYESDEAFFDESDEEFLQPMRRGSLERATFDAALNRNIEHVEQLRNKYRNNAQVVCQIIIGAVKGAAINRNISYIGQLRNKYRNNAHIVYEIIIAVAKEAARSNHLDTKHKKILWMPTLCRNPNEIANFMMNVMGNPTERWRIANKVAEATEWIKKNHEAATTIQRYTRGYMARAALYRDRLFEQGMLCSLCMDKENTHQLEPCRHKFCESCISTWRASQAWKRFEHRMRLQEVNPQSYTDSCPYCRCLITKCKPIPREAVLTENVI